MNTNFAKVSGYFVSLGILIASFAQSALAEEVTIMLPGDVPMVLVRIPAGTFLMGSPPGERGNIFNNEGQHQVTLTQDYFMGKTEVTQKQWQAVMGTPMPSTCGTPAVGDDYPVYCATWNDMAGPGGFIEKLNAQQSVGEFRLPTEAEWERAARANTTTRFSHGDVLQCGDNCEACAEHNLSMQFCGNNIPAGPKPVGQKLANAFGLHDMHGNLYELVNDRYSDGYGAPAGQAAVNPTGPGGFGDIVFRGGGATGEAWLARSAARFGGSPSQTNTDIGFRVAASGLSAAFQINAGLNDAWVSADAALQGIFFTVFEDTGVVFMAWFTYDSVLPAGSSVATFGAIDQRWVTGAGLISGDTVTINVENTSGGIFNGSMPTASQQSNYGTVTVVFKSCNEAVLTYNFPSLGLSGEITLTRALPDNIAVCEMMASQ